MTGPSRPREIPNWPLGEPPAPRIARNDGERDQEIIAPPPAVTAPPSEAPAPTSNTAASARLVSLEDILRAAEQRRTPECRRWARINADATLSVRVKSADKDRVEAVAARRRDYPSTVARDALQLGMDLMDLLDGAAK